VALLRPARPVPAAGCWWPTAGRCR